MSILAKTYDGERLYILETTYGCYSDYGWSFAAGYDHFCDAEAAYNHWTRPDRKTGGEYRVIDNSNGDILLGPS